MKYKCDLVNKNNWKDPVKERNNKRIQFTAGMGRFNVGFLAWATLHIDIVVAAIIFELWVIWFILIRYFDTQKSKQLRFGGQTYFFFAFAFIGILFVNIAPQNSLQITSFGKIINWGSLIAVIGSLLAALSTARNIQWGESSSDTIWKQYTCLNGPKIEQKEKLITGYTMLASALASGVVTIVCGIILLAQGIFDTDSNSIFSKFIFQGIWVVLFAGAILGSTTTICYRLANQKNASLEINALAYLMPVLAVTWLLTLGENRITRIDLLLLGASIVVAVNIILYFDTEGHRLGYRFLVVALWSCGVIVLLRDSLLGDSFLWKDASSNFAFLALSATVYILLFSFRMLKISEKIKQDEKIAYSLHSRMVVLRYPETAIKSIEFLQKAKSNREIYENYTIVKKAIENEKSSLKAFERSDMIKDLNLLLRGKTTGMDSIEISVLVIFCLTTVLISLFTSPILSKWNGYVVDLFSILFSATIIFLTASLADTYRQSKESIFSRIEEKMSNSTLYYDSEYRMKLTNFLSYFLVFSMISLFIILLIGKWLVKWGFSESIMR